MRLIRASEPSGTRRRVYFHLVATDGVAPATAEGGGQPQVSLNGGAWTSTGIGTLVAVGQGRYYATLDDALGTAGDLLETRYKSVSTAECPGDTVFYTAFDPAQPPPGTATLLDAVAVEPGLNARQALALLAAVLLGRHTGASTGTETFLAAGGTDPRVVGTIDTRGNRTAITLTPPA